MRFGVEYQKKDEEAYAAEVRAKLEKSFHRRAKELGYEVKKIEVPVEASSVEVSSSA